MDVHQEKMILLLYSDFRARLLRVYEDMKRLHGMQMRCTCGIRTFKEQQDLYNQGRTKPGRIVTNRMPGTSTHNYGIAADSCFDLKDDPYLDKHKDSEFLWSEFGRLGVAHGLRWGGNFTTILDKPHLEAKYEVTLDELHMIYDSGGLNAVYSKLDKIVYGKL